MIIWIPLEFVIEQKIKIKTKDENVASTISKKTREGQVERTKEDRNALGSISKPERCSCDSWWSVCCWLFACALLLKRLLSCLCTTEMTDEFV